MIIKLNTRVIARYEAISAEANEAVICRVEVALYLAMTRL